MEQSILIRYGSLRLVFVYALLFLLAAASAALAAPRIITLEINKGEMVKLNRPAASVVLADPDTADVQVVSPRLIFVRGTQVGETSLYIIDADDNEIMTSTVRVTHNLSSLSNAVKQVVPNADVTFRTVDGGMVLEGRTNSVDESEKIQTIASAFLREGNNMVNMIKTNGSDQVMLKVKLVEMSRTNLKRLGVNLQHLTQNGNLAYQVLQGQDVLFHTPDPDVNLFRSAGNTLVRGAENNSSVLLSYDNTFGVLEALETQGLAHVLAEPSLTTTSGQEASFLAGGQYPLPVTGSDGTVTLEYQEFGVSLRFTPVVMSPERISLSVSPEVSTLNFNNPIQISGITYPILETRRASATVELGSGDSFVLAGLLKNERNNNISKFPGVGDLPILGSLFRSTEFQNNETELVMLVTPYIVRPVADSKKLQTPLDGYKPPTEYDRITKGSLYQQQSMNKSKPAKKTSNDTTNTAVTGAVESKDIQAGPPATPSAAPVRENISIPALAATEHIASSEVVAKAAVPGLHGNNGFLFD